MTPRKLTESLALWITSKSSRERAQENGIELWDFRTVLKGVADACDSRTYFSDDTLRTLQLFCRTSLETSSEDLS